jgi:hypothetical protein
MDAVTLYACCGVVGVIGVPVTWLAGWFIQNWKHLPIYPQKLLGAAPVVGLGVWVAICAEAKLTATNATANNTLMNALRFVIKNKHKMRFNLVEMPKIEIKIKKKRKEIFMGVCFAAWQRRQRRSV